MRRIGLDFLAKRAHEYAQRRKVRLVLDTPNLIQDKAVRKDPVHIVRQQIQEIILDGCQMQFLAGQVCHARRIVDTKISVLEDGALTRRGIRKVARTAPGSRGYALGTRLSKTAW